MAKSTNELLMDISNDVASTKTKVNHVQVNQLKFEKAMFGPEGDGGMIGSIQELKTSLRDIQKEHKACIAVRKQLELDVVELKEFKRKHDFASASAKAKWKAVGWLITKSGISLTGIGAIIFWIWGKIEPALDKIIFHSSH